MESYLDESPNWKLLADCKCVSMDNICVEFSSLHNRLSFPNSEDRFKDLWEEKIKENNRLYNMSKFRLKSIQIDSKIYMNIGITDYRETICTNHLNSVRELQNYGTDTYNDIHACFGDAIGVGGLVITKDDFLILQKRSNWVAESKGCFDTPGGHAEPEEMLKKLNMSSSEVYNVRGSDVIYEIFHSFVREVRDEVNVPENYISWPLLLGIARNKVYGWKPGMIFYVRCDLIKEEVEKLYSQGGPETDESTELKFIHVKELLDNDFLSQEIDMAPLCRASIQLYLHHYPMLHTK